MPKKPEKQKPEKQVCFIKTNEKCDKCNRTAEVKHYNFKYCNGCFMSIMKRRMKKELRGKLKYGKTYIVDSEILLFFMKKLYDFDFKIGKNAEITSTNLDDINSQYFDFLFHDTAIDERGLIMPFRNITSDELSIISSIVNIPHPTTSTLIDDLDNRFRGIKFTFNKNMKKIYPLLKK